MDLFAEAKADARQAIHDRLAVSANYTLGATEVRDDPEGLRLTVRWHNKLAKVGQLDGGFDAQLIEGIDRLVFNEPQLLALGIELARNAIVEVPSWRASFQLAAREPNDGPLNIYWQVTRLRD